MTIQDAPPRPDPDTVEGRVDAGFRYLSGQLPDWRDYIRRGSLDVEKEDVCVLGQLDRHPTVRRLSRGGAGGFARTRNALGLSNQDCQRYGFLSSSLGMMRGSAEYRRLTAEWDRRIFSSRRRRFVALRRLLHV